MNVRLFKKKLSNECTANSRHTQMYQAASSVENFPACRQLEAICNNIFARFRGYRQEPSLSFYISKTKNVIKNLTTAITVIVTSKILIDKQKIYTLPHPSELSDLL